MTDDWDDDALIYITGYGWATGRMLNQAYTPPNVEVMRRVAENMAKHIAKVEEAAVRLIPEPTEVRLIQLWGQDRVQLMNRGAYLSFPTEQAHQVARDIMNAATPPPSEPAPPTGAAPEGKSDWLI